MVRARWFVILPQSNGCRQNISLFFFLFLYLFIFSKSQNGDLIRFPDDLWAWYCIACAVAYLDFRRNNLFLTFRLVVAWPAFVIPFGASLSFVFFELVLIECCTAINFSSRFECFFVPVRFCRKHNITLRVIAWCMRTTYIGSHIGGNCGPRLRYCRRRRSRRSRRHGRGRFVICLAYHTLNQ